MLFAWIAAHLGCVFGRQRYFWAFNSLHTIISRYASEWPSFLLQSADPRKVEYTLEFAIACHNGPGMNLVLLGSFVVWAICIVMRKWILLYISMFICFAVIDFYMGLLWKV